MRKKSELILEEPRSLNESIRIFIRTVKEIRFGIIFLVVGALVTGTMIQLNWIHHNCTLNTNAAQVERICRDIPLRLGFGGPLFIIIFFILFTLIGLVYIRLLNNTDFKNILNRISISFGIFILFGISPLFNWNEGIYYVTFLMWLTTPFFILRNETIAILTNTFSNSPGSLRFEYNRDELEVIFEGKLTQEMVKDHLNQILSQILEDNVRKKVTLNLQEVDEIDEEGFSLIAMYISFAKIHNFSLNLTGQHSAKLTEFSRKFFKEYF